MGRKRDNLRELLDSLHEANQTDDRKKIVDALLKLSEYYYNNSNYEKSILLLKQCLEVDSKLSNVNYYLALCNIHQSKDEVAKKYLREEIKINPNHPLAKDLLTSFEVSSNFPFVTMLIFLISLFAFFFTFPQPNYSELLRFSFNSFNATFFSLVTSLFFHANYLHFLFNLFVLLMFGIYLEKFIGSFKFALIFILSGFVGNYFEFLVNSQGFVLGMSASLFGLFGTIVMREPLLGVRVFGLVKIPVIFVFGGFFAIQGLIASFVSSNSILYGEIAHLFGFLMGVLITGIFYRSTIKFFYNWMAMAFGFWAVVFSIRGFFSLITLAFDLNDFVISIALLLTGIFLIFYSYIKLKLVVKIGGEEVEIN